jgi:hypothetical protein
VAIEKRHVRGVSTVTVGLDHDGNPVNQVHQFDDYVPVDILDAYLEDARKRFSTVQVVSDEHNPGPAGDDGLTHYPHHLSEGHPHRGKTVDGSGKIVEA